MKILVWHVSLAVLAGISLAIISYFCYHYLSGIPGPSEGMCSPEPRLFPAEGQPWPMPFSWESGDTLTALDVANFHFRSEGVQCDVLREAFNRFQEAIFGRRLHGGYRSLNR